MTIDAEGNTVFGFVVTAQEHIAFFPVFVGKDGAFTVTEGFLEAYDGKTQIIDFVGRVVRSEYGFGLIIPEILGQLVFMNMYE